MGWAAAIPAITSIAGSVMGANAASDAANQQRDAVNQNRALLNSIELPDIEKQKLAYEMYKSQGDYKPDYLQNLLQQGPSAFENMSTDPRLEKAQKAQRDALGGMSEIAMSGMTNADKLLSDLNAQKQAGAANAIMQKGLMDQQARGLGSSGAAYSLMRQANQDSSQQAQEKAIQQEIAKQQNTQNALQQLAAMSGNMRTQDYNQKADLFNKRDTIAATNMNNANRLAENNMSLRNSAALANLQNKQNLANSNVGLSNEQQLRNKSLLQQQYNNKIARATGNASLNNASADISATKAMNYGDMQSTVGKGLGGMAAKYFSQGEEPKKTPFDPSDFNQA